MQELRPLQRRTKLESQKKAGLHSHLPQYHQRLLHAAIPPGSAPAPAPVSETRGLELQISMLLLLPTGSVGTAGPAVGAAAAPRCIASNRSSK